VLRVETAAGVGDFSLRPDVDDYSSDRLEGTFGGADATWVGTASLAAGSTPSLAVYCYGSEADFDFRAELYDVPTAPASYSGMTTGSGSELFFSVPSTAPYVADLTLPQGSVSLDGKETSERDFASSGSYSLGMLARGLHSLTVHAGDGPTSRWTITIHPQPVAVSGATFDRATIKPGAITTASYQLNADATVSATVVDAMGKEVRHLGAGFTAKNGKHTLRWDGFDDKGVPVADGLYQLKLTAIDSVGTSDSGEAQVTVDGHGPVVSLLSPLRIRSTRAVALRVADQLSALKSATLLVDGHQVARNTSGVFVYRPRAGWRKGTHSLLVLSADRLGNASSFTRTLTIN
jgi:hypothetical protein